MTCGRLAFNSAPTTETADVIAGSEVGFRVSWDGNGAYGMFWHQGPAQIYLSKVPEGVAMKDYSGIEGDWFKIAWSPPEDQAHWPLWGEPDVSCCLFLSLFSEPQHFNIKHFSVEGKQYPETKCRVSFQLDIPLSPPTFRHSQVFKETLQFKRSSLEK